jgi:membrane-bound lytic murein transglycosylase B
MGRLALVAVLVTGLGMVAWVMGTDTSDTSAQAEPLAIADVLAADVQPGAVPPVTGEAAVPVPRSATGPDALADWADTVAGRTTIPARALRAYGNADLLMRAERPGCKITWVTLAGIGRVESNHGRYAGAQLGADGRPEPPIIGVALDGRPGVMRIGDTDDGVFDGDKVFDRAVGPMQFIPSTWKRFGGDGDGDGKKDPQDIDDAAVAAANYLCADKRDMSSGQGWWAGLFSYNRSDAYGRKVFGLADSYAKASKDEQS